MPPGACIGIIASANGRVGVVADLLEILDVDRPHRSSAITWSANARLGAAGCIVASQGAAACPPATGPEGKQYEPT